jgi:hypothetical protein
MKLIYIFFLLSIISNTLKAQELKYKWDGEFLRNSDSFKIAKVEIAGCNSERSFCEYIIKNFRGEVVLIIKKKFINIDSLKSSVNKIGCIDYLDFLFIHAFKKAQIVCSEKEIIDNTFIHSLIFKLCYSFSRGGHLDMGYGLNKESASLFIKENPYRFHDTCADPTSP